MYTVNCGNIANTWNLGLFSVFDSRLSLVTFVSALFLDGKFGAFMQVHIQNDGPVTIELTSPTGHKDPRLVRYWAWRFGQSGSKILTRGSFMISLYCSTALHQRMVFSQAIFTTIVSLPRPESGGNSEHFPLGSVFFFASEFIWDRTCHNHMHTCPNGSQLDWKITVVKAPSVVMEMSRLANAIKS